MTLRLCSCRFATDDADWFDGHEGPAPRPRPAGVDGVEGHG